MTAFKHQIRSKKGVIIIISLLIASSLFALVIPDKINGEDSDQEKEQLTNTIPPGIHPLIGSSDNLVICGNDGSELHEIYLCGANAERLITTSIPNLQSIAWSRLSDTQTNCSATTNCPSNSPGCNWDDLSTDTQYNVTQEGEYRILVRYNDNTTQRFYFNVYANGLNPSAVVENIDCGSPGSIAINNVPSTYQYSINNGATWQTSNVFSITSVSTYDILIRRLNDTNGCLFALNDIAVNNNAIDAVATVLPITCNSALGAIQVDITNASSTYVYQISQGGSLINSSGPITNNSYTFTNLNAGTYDIHVTLASVSACSWVAQQTVAPFANVQPDAVVTKNIDCTNGVITVSKTGGVAPFEYSLNGSATFTPFTAGNQTTIPIATAGLYAVNVRDASGCEIAAAPVNVAVQPEITYTINPQNITCNGTDDGSITINVSDTQGFSMSYSIDGANFQISNVFSNLSAGSYNVIIRKQKAGGLCDLPPSTHVVTQSPAFTVSASVTQQIDCTNGQANIAANVTAGGTAPFEYSLDGNIFQANASFTGLGPGNYTVTARDNNGCLTTVDQTVNAGSNPSDLTFLTSNIDCATGATDVQITVQNGNAPFTYRITAPTVITAPDDTFTALAPNTYTFEVTANDGCRIVRNFVVPDPIQFTSNALVRNNVSCATGTSDGSIELSVENFNTSYTVVVEDSSGNPLALGLSNQTTSPLLITGLAADSYTLRINDESGPCQRLIPVTIVAPATPLAIDSFAVNNMNCGAPGSVTIEASGGWGNYRYSVQQPDNSSIPLQSNKTITGLTQAGTHIITLVDANGCTLNTETFDLIDQGGPIAVVDQVASNYCYSLPTPGVLKIDITDNGSAPYFYTVNDGTPMPITGGTFTLFNRTPGTYIIKVKGNNGCETIVADTNISGQLFAIANITKPLGCGVTPDAIVVVSPEEGYPPYTYRVDSGSGYSTATMPFSTATAGSYTFEVTDAKGCTFITDVVNVTSSPPLTTAHNISNTACGKDGTGSIELIAQGGTPPFSYSFNGSPFTAQTLYTDLDAASYNYSIRDALGCEILDQVVIIGAQAAITADVSHTNISCNPVVPPGGNIWGNTKIENIQNATGLLSIRLIRVSSTAAHAAGTARYWTFREYNNVDMSLPAHADGFDIRMDWPLLFYVEVEDERGCIFESSLFQVTQPPLPWFQRPAAELDQSCANGATFQIEIGDPVGLVGPFSYRIWPYDEDNPPAWRNFQNATHNEALGEDVDPGIVVDLGGGIMGIPERDFRVSGLLFGVDYSIVIRDDSTGCQRWLTLGRVNAPAAPDNNIDVVSTVQSLSCWNSSDGRVRLTVSGAGDADSDGDQTVQWSIRHSDDRGSIHNTHPWIPSFRQSGTFVGPATGDFDIDLSGLRTAWYVVEVITESGCRSGNRFPIYRPQSALKIVLDQKVDATCNLGGQISITASGGWNNQNFFNARNRIDQTGWHPYEYAFVLNGTDPHTLPAAAWGSQSYQVVNPTAYDGTNNVYQVYVRDGGGCVAGLGSPVTINYANVPVIDNITVTNRCTSTNEIYNVVATLTNPGTNPVNGAPRFIWDGQVTTNSTAQLGPGNHTLQVRDENGCSVSQNIFIYPQMAAPSARIIQTEQCNPTNSGEVAIDVYGGSLDYTYEKIVGGTVVETHVSGTPNAEIFTGLTHSVLYTFRVTDNLSGCGFRETTISLDQPVLPEFVGQVVQNISCNGADDGIIRIIQIPGANNLDIPYEYSLDGVSYQTSNVFSGLAAGMYTSINVRSSKNCIQSIPDIEIIDIPVLAISSTSVSPFACTADNNLGMATVTVNVTGGTGSGTYNYSYNGSSYTASNTYAIPFLTTARTISVDVIDANNCPVATTINIPAASKISASISTTTAMTCVTDGVYEINVGPSFTNISVVQLPGSSAPVTLSGARNTTVTILAGNPDTYSFLITDNDTGCTAQITQVVAPFDTIDVIAAHGSNIICHGASDGALNFTASGFGAGGFDYVVYRSDNTVVQAMVNSSSTSAVAISGLPAGTFYVEVTDVATGCTEQSESISIQSPVAPLDFSIATTQVLSCIGADAQITLTPVGGWGSYEFEVVETLSGNTIQAFNSNNVIGNLTGIGYDVRVRDVRGCLSPPRSVNITPIDPIVINESTDLIAVNPSCPGSNDGSITIVVSRLNGPSNYEYILTNLATGVSTLPQSSNTFGNLYAGSYSITVQDALNCSDNTDMPIVLSNPFVLEIDGAITQEPTCAPNSGEITVSATGNIGDIFEYQMIRPTTHPSAGNWVSSNVFSNLGPALYEFKARNQFGCETPISVIRTINVVEPLTVVVDDTNTIINCNGETDAVLVAQATGGLGGYLYELEVNGMLTGTPQASGIFNNLGQGSYRIRAISGADCEDYNDTPIVISEPPVLSASLGAVQNILCFNETNGSIEVNALGGVAPYQFTISSEPQKAVNTNLFENLAGGTYSVIVQDTNGCEVLIDNIVVDSPSAPLAANVTRVFDEVCSTDDNGSIELSFTGGTPPYAYNITDSNDPYQSFSGSTLVIDNLDGGFFYTIFIRDSNGCEEILIQEVRVGVDLTASHETIYECIDGQPFHTTSVILENAELGNEVIYALDSEDPSVAQVSNVFENIPPGNHFISILHEGGCIERLDITIDTVVPLTLTSLDGEINQISVEAAGGDGSYTYYFEDKPSSVGTYYINSDGIYTVRVVDGLGCETSINIPMEYIDIEIPNFFTPDGDGYKDTWAIRNSEGFPDIYIRIYDRYGRTIKEWIGQGEWDGSYNKADLPTGDYWYVIKLNGPRDDREFVGHVTVYR